MRLAALALGLALVFGGTGVLLTGCGGGHKEQGSHEIGDPDMPPPPDDGDEAGGATDDAEE
jgi:hypothetical protein